MKELIAELGQLLQPISSADHRSTAGDLVAAVRDGSREAIGAWLPERSQGRDRADLDRMIDVLTDSWWRLLSDDD